MCRFPEGTISTSRNEENTGKYGQIEHFLGRVGWGPFMAIPVPPQIHPDNHQKRDVLLALPYEPLLT
ncbi:hypothetical protein J2129_000850 [Methanofollis sp. W23]|nr:hypothetical protein [Methanofollis sp. W23]